MSTWPSTQRAHDIRARPAAPASWPAARAASFSVSLLVLNASRARSVSSRASMACPMNRSIMPSPRIALISMGRSLRASARPSKVAVASRACGSSPRITLPVASQNITCRYSGGSPRREQSSRPRAKIAIAALDAGPWVARPQGELEIKLESVPPRALRQTACGLYASLQMGDCFDVGEALDSVLAGLQPITHRLFKHPGFGEMLRQRFRFGFHDFRESLLECASDCCMHDRAPGFQQAGIGRVSNQHMLKGI